MDIITQRVQALPGEFYDHIYREVFSAAPAEIKVDSSYKPPSCLQVSKSSRTAFAQEYYVKGIFIFDNQNLANQWCFSLSEAAIGLLHDIRLATEVNPDDIQIKVQTLPPQPAPNGFKARISAQGFQEKFLAELLLMGVQIKETVLHVDAHFREENGNDVMFSID